jgi:predicted nucleic acid-binding protein
VAYLLDTNIVSELRKKRRNANVVAWVAALRPDDAYLSVITIGEITRGIAKRRRDNGSHEADELQAWLDGLLTTYADRIVPIDILIAARWGRLCEQHPQLATDMLLAATALERDLTVATRNVAHFSVANVPTLNPF